MENIDYEMTDISPCVACKNAFRCEVAMLACQAMAAFVSTGKYDVRTERDPTRQIYRRVYSRRET